MPVELVVPKVGESITQVEVGDWLKKDGDRVERDETLVMLESEKTTVELPSPVAGVLSRVVKQTGETVEIGEVLALIEEGATASTNGSAPSATTQAQGAQAQPEWREPAHLDQQNTTVSPEMANPSFGVAGGGVPANEAQTPESALGADGGAKPTAESQAAVVAQTPTEASVAADSPLAKERVMPAAARVLAQHNLSANEVEASGPGGRMLKEDVERRVENGAAPPAATPPATVPATAPVAQSSTRLAAQPAVQPTTQPAETRADEELVPMSFLRRKVAERLVEAQQTAALLTTFNEIDMTSVMEMRKAHQDQFTKKHGVKLGFMSFFVKAAVDALKQTPGVNAEVRGKDIVYKNHYDVGVAIGGGKGLVVPVLKNAERMSFAEIEKKIGDYAARAKDGKLLPDELMGGTFTITNGGIYGSLMSTPIVNPPQSGILGMHTIQERPIALNGQVVIRPMMYIALTYDHRIVDGREAVTFLVRIKDCIENPARMLMEV